MWAQSEQFAQISKLLQEYSIITFSDDWCKVDEKIYNATRVLTIALNTDAINDLICNLEYTTKIYNLTSSFANELFKTFVKKFDYFTKISENVYIEPTSNYGVLTLTSGDDGDYIYLMTTDF